MTALVLAEHDNKSIKGPTLNTVTAAAKAGWRRARAGGRSQRGRRRAGGGEDRRRQQGAARRRPAVRRRPGRGGRGAGAGRCRLATRMCFAPATSYGKNVLPRVAAKLDAAQVSDISSVESPDTFTRPIYAGNAIATVQSGDKIKVVTARPTNFDAAPADGGSAAVENVTAVAASRQPRASSAAISPSPTGRNSRARRSSSPADAAWGRPRTSSCSSRWPTS